MNETPPKTDKENTARMARALLRHCGSAVLATLFSGAPYTSLVLAVADLDGSPILLQSDLAQGTRNLKADPRASLIVSAGENKQNPLDSPRLTLLGSVEVTGDPRHRRRYLARQPQTSLYADFGDFHFYRMTIERAHLVSGFGKVAWFKAADLLIADGARALAGVEVALTEWMNGDQRGELDLCANRLAGLSGTGWQATGIDPDGIDLRRADDTARLDFAAPASGEEAFHAAFADLVAAARRAGAD